MNHFVYFDGPAFHFLAFHPLAGIPILGAFVYAMLGILTPVAASLTSWEAAYRGLRLPLPVVQRGMDFHAANYLPVGLLTALTIIGYCQLAQLPQFGDRIGLNDSARGDFLQKSSLHFDDLQGFLGKLISSLCSRIA